MITADRVSRDILVLGVAPRDVVMVHVSLRAIGPLKNGATGLLEALRTSMGDQGTLLMVLGANIAHDWVNKRPESEREAVLADAAVFDPLSAPVFSEVGYFAEVFRRARGTLVSDNPSGRFGAQGRLAELLLRDAPWDDYYGSGSPLERLCEAGGKMLRIGADPDTTTVLHFAESWPTCRTSAVCAATIVVRVSRGLRSVQWSASTMRTALSTLMARTTSRVS